MAYIYFDYKELGNQEPTSVLASLVKQLANQTRHLPTEIEELYKKLKEEGRGPTFEELYSALLTVKSFPRTFVACDALDECGQKSRMNLLPLFH